MKEKIELSKGQLADILLKFKWYCSWNSTVNQLDEETYEIVCEVNEKEWLETEVFNKIEL